MLTKTTKRLKIRPLRRSDYAVWAAYYASMGPKKNTWDVDRRSKKDRTPAAFKKFHSKLEKLQKQDQYYYWLIFEKRSGELVGRMMAMNPVRSIIQSAYIAYDIHQAHWGKGFGKEAAAALLRLCFGPLKLHRVEGVVEPGNTRSIRILKDLGFRHEGIKRRFGRYRGQWRDMAMYAICAEERKNRR